MSMWKGLILLGLLLVGCSSDPAVNQATHDRAVSELRAEIHAARDMVKDQTAINTSLTEVYSNRRCGDLGTPGRRAEQMGGGAKVRWVITKSTASYSASRQN